MLRVHWTSEGQNGDKLVPPGWLEEPDTLIRTIYSPRIYTHRTRDKKLTRSCLENGYYGIGRCHYLVAASPEDSLPYITRRRMMVVIDFPLSFSSQHFKAR